MSNQPTLAQFMNADFNIITPGFVGGDPAITVENATMNDPFYYELDVTDWDQLRQAALCETDDEEFASRVNEVEIELAEEYGINL